MQNVMVDLETLGTAPGCVILSIGAVAFDNTKLGAEFYTVINVDDQMAFGMATEPGTLKWWGQQSEEAKNVLVDASTTKVTYRDGLNLFTKFLIDTCGTGVKVWGNGASFDNAILAASYKNRSMQLPWKFYNDRCYRTMKGLCPSIKLTRSGTYHNALDDAISQAEHLINILTALKINV